MGLYDLGSVYVDLPGLGIKIIVEFFQLVGVKCRAIQALYITNMYCIIFKGRCVRTWGLRLSGPGNFFALNPLKTVFNLSMFIQLYFSSSRFV